MPRKSAPSTSSNSAEPKLLSGGNPQIAKGDGDGPVQAYIAALPGWKHEAGRQLDALVTEALPDVAKAVKWNSPFYGVAPGDWFLSFHAMTKYIKVAFFSGAELFPPPPESSTQPRVRYWHLREGETIDAARFMDWVQQASKLPGMRM